MNITEQTSVLIKTIEASIADKEKQLSDLGLEIKAEKAQLRKLNKIFDEHKGNKTTLDKEKPA